MSARTAAREGEGLPVGAAPVTVATLLAEARGMAVQRLDAQLWLAEVLQRPRAGLLAHPDLAVGAAEAARFRDGLARRAGGEPLAYLVGRKEFHGLMLGVNAHVLVPRPETETLVDWGLELLSGALADRVAPAVLDLGTGSGAIALAIKRARPDAQVCAVERSAAALEVARRNGRDLALEIEWHRGDWWAPLAGRRFDLVVANPPYIAQDDAHLPALRAEPQAALVAGPQGLDDLQTIAAQAPQHLRDGGWLLLEHGHDQARPVRALLQAQGLADVATRPDLAGVPRCTGARRLTSEPADGAVA